MGDWAEDKWGGWLVKIVTLEAFAVPPRWVFLKITTDEGLVGWGEPIVEGHAASVLAAVQEAADWVQGSDAKQIEDIWQVLYRGRFYRGGPIMMSVIAGIDQALWDIKGRWLGVPVWELLGGRVREGISAYAWIGGDRPQSIAMAARMRVAEGFTVVKMNASAELHYIDCYKKVDEVIARVGEVRDSVGNDVGIGLDFHGRVHKAMAKVLARELEHFNLLFIEEPVLPENDEALREIVRYSTIPVATGERRYSRWDFKFLLSSGLVDIVQPDLSHAGGISEVKKIASMAEAFDVAVAPHCPLGPIALASCLQLDCCTPNAVLQEVSLGIHYNQAHELTDYILNPDVFILEDGRLGVPKGAGLGVEINEEYVRKAATTTQCWHNPVWRNVDGTVAEW
jgi:galactonate dehydratase